MKNEKPPKKVISVVVPNRTWSEMVEIIKSENISISQWVCMAIVREIERHHKIHKKAVQ